MKSFILCVVLILASVPACADTFSIYFVRHMEKQTKDTDPGLTLAGQQRAQLLAQFLQHANIETIFSTPFKRTQQTAQPLAKQLDLSIQDYPSSDFDSIIKSINRLKKNALVVGHSNTVSALVKTAGGEADTLSEDDYGDVFQVMINDETVTTTRFYVPALN